MPKLAENLKHLLSIRFLVGTVTLASFLYFFSHILGYKEFINSPMSYSDSFTLEIKKGQSASELSIQLKNKGLIKDDLYMRILLRLRPELSKIKVGEYLIKPSMSPVELLDQLVKGKVIQYSITFVEGMNIYQVMERLASKQDLIKDWPDDEKELALALGIPYDKVEGWLYPDTYNYTRGSSGLEILKRAYAKMETLLHNEWENRLLDLPYNSPYEALIMASIIEKETGIASERDEIAGVFVRRLNKNMRLQTDPTVIYGVWSEYEGDITYKHLRTPTAYNTYVIKGLPPSPIAMPGREAINAALNPADGEWLYFVATGDGGHKFSRTLEEHNIALKEYLRKIKKRK